MNFFLNDYILKVYLSNFNFRILADEFIWNMDRFTHEHVNLSVN